MSQQEDLKSLYSRKKAENPATLAITVEKLSKRASVEEMPDLHPAYIRQRRNLILSSFALIYYSIFIEKFDGGFPFFGGKVITRFPGDSLFIYTAMFLVAYFMWRAWQRLDDSIFTISARCEQELIKELLEEDGFKYMNLLASPLSYKYEIYRLEHGDYIIAEHHLLKGEYKDQESHIVQKKRFRRKYVKKYFKQIFRDSKASDYLLPMVLGFSAILIGLVRLFEESITC